MNRINSGEIHRVISRHYKLNESDPIMTIGTEILPVMILEDFKRPHPSDTEVNRGVYAAVSTAVLVGDTACTFVIFNLANSGIYAELCQITGGSTYATDFRVSNCTLQNPYTGGTGLPKFLHLDSTHGTFGGLQVGVDTNRLASVNGGGTTFSIRRSGAADSRDMLYPGCPVFIVPGTGVRLQITGGTAGTVTFSASWIERKISVPA